MQQSSVYDTIHMRTKRVGRTQECVRLIAGDLPAVIWKVAALILVEGTSMLLQLCFKCTYMYANYILHVDLDSHQ